MGEQCVVVDTRPITLAQVLKLANCVENGGEAKVLIAAGRVLVNGEVESRKRRKLVPGDMIAIEDGPTVRLVPASAGTVGPRDG